jgi:hypothetical protein
MVGHACVYFIGHSGVAAAGLRLDAALPERRL